MANQRSGRLTLLNIPPELRNQIYQDTFEDGDEKNLQVLLTCRQIYNEACIVAFTATTFKISRTALSPYVSLDFLKPELKAAISQVELTLDGPSMSLFQECYCLQLQAMHKNQIYPRHYILRSLLKTSLGSARGIRPFRHWYLQSGMSMTTSIDLERILDQNPQLKIVEAVCAPGPNMDLDPGSHVSWNLGQPYQVTLDLKKLLAQEVCEASEMLQKLGDGVMGKTMVTLEGSGR